jgi:rfaE bifunctional protein kinase chain/domain
MCVNKDIKRIPLLFDLYTDITTKTRIWSQGQQICRIDKEDTRSPSRNLELQWIAKLSKLIEKEDIKIVIFSDYNKGTLTDSLINELTEICNRRKIKTILDPKRPSFYSIRGLTTTKPNVRELAATNLSPIECSKEMVSTWLIHTLGKDGIAVYRHGEKIFACPTVSKEVIDVCGCGDTVTAMIALSFLDNNSIGDAVKAANKGASFTITHKGCYILTKDEIEVCLNDE